MGAAKGYDCIIVGGGPAGLSAALLLGRSNRRVLLVDDGNYRNKDARRIHGFLGHDGVTPDTLRSHGRVEVRGYDVHIERDRIVSAEYRPDLAQFAVRLLGWAAVPSFEVMAKTMVLATGVVDVLPNLAGLGDCYGQTVHLCPYCDGYEHRGKRLGVHGRGGEQLARALLGWSQNVTWFAEGVVGGEQRASLTRAGIYVVQVPVEALEHNRGALEWVRLRDGSVVARDALFLSLPAGQRQRSHLAESLGVRLRPDGGLEHEGGATRVPGLFVAGDMTRDFFLAIKAASEGAEVGIQCNQFLLERWPSRGGGT